MKPESLKATNSLIRRRGVVKIPALGEKTTQREGTKLEGYRY